MKANSLVAFLSFILSVALTGCHDAPDSGGEPNRDSDFHKTIGEQIPYETAQEWMALYRQNTDRKGRTEGMASYFMPAAQLKTALTSVTDLTGVAFHYGVDELGEKHLLAVPVNGSLSLWSGYTERTIIDASTGKEVDQETAMRWADDFKTAYEEEVWFHFFGKNVFDEILALPGMDTLDIEPATSALDLTPQLLLIVWGQETSSTGRTSREQAVVYDASNACPPCSVE